MMENRLEDLRKEKARLKVNAECLRMAKEIYDFLEEHDKKEKSK
jgi:hypothetical protein